jgi:hypothetical protein
MSGSEPRPENVDELAVATASRRLDALASHNPDLRGTSGPENVDAWIETLETDEKGPKMAAKEETEQVAFRFPKSLVKRLDRYATQLAEDHPGLEFSRADAVRTLLTRALDEVEGNDKRRKG